MRAWGILLGLVGCSPPPEAKETHTPVVSVVTAAPSGTELPPEPIAFGPKGDLGKIVTVEASAQSPRVDARALVWRTHADEVFTMALRFGPPVVPQKDERAFGDPDAALAKVEVRLTSPSGETEVRSATFPTAPRGSAINFWPGRSLFLDIGATGVRVRFPGRVAAPWAEGALNRDAPGSGVSPGRQGTWYVGVTSHIVLPGSKQKLTLASGRVPFDVQPTHPSRSSMMIAAEATRVGVGASNKHEPTVEAGFVEDTLIQLDDDRWVARFAKPAVWAFQLTSVFLSPEANVLEVETIDVSTCIAESMHIDTPAGPRAVEDLAVGDLVWGWSLERAARVATPVLATTAYPSRPTVWLGRLQLAPSHPVWTSGAWHMAGDLPQASPGARATVYALTVGPPHTFFAEGVLVHNKDRMYSDNLDDPWVFMWAPKAEWWK